MGLTQVPSTSVLKEWLIAGLTGSCGGTYSRVTGMYDGGWWFDRSHWAVWPGNTEGTKRGPRRPFTRLNINLYVLGNGKRDDCCAIRPGRRCVRI